MTTDEELGEISESRKPYDPERVITVALVTEMIEEIQGLIEKIAMEKDAHPKYSRERIELLGQRNGLCGAVMIIERYLEKGYE